MQYLERHWQTWTALTVALLPLSAIFCVIVALRRWAYRVGILRRTRLPIPVIVVGNISVGGTGKTPLVIALVELLRAHGWRPGVITRGYGGNATSWPQAVTAASDPTAVGDEAVLIARRTGVPVMAGPQRRESARALLAQACDIVISDDGLQHYALVRDLEIAVIDGARGLGNGLCLPAGPLRESRARLRTVDARVVQGVAMGDAFVMRLQADDLRAVANERTVALVDLPRRVHAVAGIGNPARFFSSLSALGLTVVPHPFPDHHRFTAADLDFGDTLPVIMTEKDAVKCRAFARADVYYLPVRALLPAEFDTFILTQANGFRHGQKTS